MANKTWKIKRQQVKPYRAMITAYEVDKQGDPTGRETTPEPFDTMTQPYNYEELVGRIDAQISKLDQAAEDEITAEIENKLAEVLLAKEKVV